ncbi:CocE/NonD family hydrolase C-terminal non-catalytic domain-containing protein [Streptomyces reniochalinae]|uniref:CocE/NonD family hydrolase C-terminal non-catalytic domain-containing protein n=1 Tax=Streptomyces reniochalinae TaxID=2250578 RepID=UPI001FEAED09|nr:CocE/NonD family hydrolase C-terminal non-catalytic domain-containing protein [Streptomyces reniochalinae]
MEEPRLRAWMPDSAPVGSDRELRPGRWVTEPSWPAPGVAPQRTALSPWSDGPATAQLRSALPVGAASGDFLKFGDVPGQYGDQAAGDGRSHTFTGPVLEEGVEILGAPSVTLRVTADRPQAQLAVRLCEVFPDGPSKLVTTGLLNLTHRDGHAEPEPLEPGRAYDVRVPLFAIGHRLRRGQPRQGLRLRVPVAVGVAVAGFSVLTVESRSSSTASICCSPRSSPGCGRSPRTRCVRRTAWASPAGRSSSGSNCGSPSLR